MNGIDVCTVDRLSDISASTDQLSLTLLRGQRELTFKIHKIPSEGAGLIITKHEIGFRVTGFKRCVPPPPPNASETLAHEIAVQLLGATHKQCEPTQWLTFHDRSILREFFLEYKLRGGFYRSSVEALKRGMLRKSVVRLIDAGRYKGWNGLFWLHPAAETLLSSLLERADEVYMSACAANARNPILESESAKVRYDPSTGVAYHFTQSGRRLYHWPKVKTKSERACSCRKPDWMRIAPRGLSEGVLTFMCLRSDVILGNTFLTGAEGCKDAGSALYSYHPLRVGDWGLESVVCDTPCELAIVSPV
jgi:hypothetical protein